MVDESLHTFQQLQAGEDTFSSRELSLGLREGRTSGLARFSSLLDDSKKRSPADRNGKHEYSSQAQDLAGMTARVLRITAGGLPGAITSAIFSNRVTRAGFWTSLSTGGSRYLEKGNGEWRVWLRGTYCRTPPRR